MKSNKKGMTLVECIIAMAVFAIATTGFTMAATACMRAQAKSHQRMTKTNVQTTNLEHFSTFSHVFDPEYSNVKPMTDGTNQFRITFPFKATTIENSNVYGYYARLDPDDKDTVYQLSFLSAADHAMLSKGEYWVTLYNYSADQQDMLITCDSDCEFFDNSNNSNHQNDMPSHLWGPNGGYMKFGVRNTKGTGATLTIHSNDGAFEDAIIKIDPMASGEDSWFPNGSFDNGGEGDNMVSIYLNKKLVFQTPEQRNKEPDENSDE